VYGDTIENEIMEYLFENKGLDFAAGDMAKELNISRPKVYAVIKKFENKGYVRKSRIVGKTQLYLLDRENPRVNLFLKTFNECLRIITEENSEKELLVAKVAKKKN
jgi:sugar-specific transcriptional regulator TrmB